MAIPVCGSQNAFFWCKEVATSVRWTSVLSLEVFDRVKLPLRNRLLSNPNPSASKLTARTVSLPILGSRRGNFSMGNWSCKGGTLASSF
jgi:hypothetical protein